MRQLPCRNPQCIYSGGRPGGDCDLSGQYCVFCGVRVIRTGQDGIPTRAAADDIRGRPACATWAAAADIRGRPACATRAAASDIRGRAASATRAAAAGDILAGAGRAAAAHPRAPVGAAER